MARWRRSEHHIPRKKFINALDRMVGDAIDDVIEIARPLIDFIDAGGGGRTRTELSLQRILSPLRMPFRHPGVLASMIVKS
jgi:hypothetical protein